MGVALVGYSFPSFFIGLLLVFFVQFKWRAHRLRRRTSPFFDDPVGVVPGRSSCPGSPWPLLYAAFYARLTRNQMLETLGEDYIRTARAKGLTSGPGHRQARLRAGLTPIVTAAGLDLPACSAAR